MKRTLTALLAVFAFAACGDDDGGGGGGSELSTLLGRDFVDVVHLRTAGSRTFFDVLDRATGDYPCDEYISYATTGSTEFMTGLQGPFGSTTVSEGDTVVAFLGNFRIPSEDDRIRLPTPNWFTNPPCIAVEATDTMMHADYVLLATPQNRVILSQVNEETGEAEPTEVTINDLMTGLKGVATGNSADAARIRGLSLFDWPPTAE